MTGTLSPHYWQHGARHVQQAEDIRVKHPSHIRIARLFHGSQQTEARIIDEYVNTPKMFQRNAHAQPDLLLIRHVERKRQQRGAAAKPLDDRCRVTPGCDHRIAVSQCRLCNQCADAPGCTGNQPDALEFVLLDVLHHSAPEVLKGRMIEAKIDMN